MLGVDRIEPRTTKCCRLGQLCAACLEASFCHRENTSPRPECCSRHTSFVVLLSVALDLASLQWLPCKSELDASLFMQAAISATSVLLVSGAWGLFAKHVLHITGLPCVGLNGTVVLLPHSEQVTCVSVVRRPPPPCLLALHCLQCFGSFVNPFSWKNCCSPAENANITSQPTHRTSRSAKGIIPPPHSANSEKGQRGTEIPLRKRAACILFLLIWKNMFGTSQLGRIFSQMQESPRSEGFVVHWSTRP